MEVEFYCCIKYDLKFVYDLYDFVLVCFFVYVREIKKGRESWRREGRNGEREEKREGEGEILFVEEMEEEEKRRKCI